MVFDTCVYLTMFRALKRFDGLLFLTTNRVGNMDDRVSAFADLAIHFEHPDRSTRKRIWHALEKRLCRNNDRIELTRNAKKFLQTSAPQVDLNGH